MKTSPPSRQSAIRNPAPLLRAILAGLMLTTVSLISCSAGEDVDDASLKPREDRGATESDQKDAFFEGNGQGATSGDAVNEGTETLCDGLDENNNGIVDDVDVGNDGLCDCIHLGFFGQISSDAGGQTGRFEAWLVERSGQIPVKRLAATDTLTADWLSDLQVLIVGGMQGRAGRSPAFSSDELAAVDDWLRNRGGGLFTLSGYTASSADAAPTNELLSTTGLGYQLSGVPAEGIIGEGAPPVWLTDIVNQEHPTVEGVPQIGVYYGYPITGEGTLILQSEGYQLAVAKEVGDGRVFVFADEWITQDQTWSGKSEGQNDSCQQPCDEKRSICGAAETNCSNCETQPCADPNDTDITTCHKGCDGACESEATRCATKTAECDDCTQQTQARAEATPRLWLQTIKWLTPANECKVRIPTNIVIK